MLGLSGDLIRDTVQDQLASDHDFKIAHWEFGVCWRSALAIKALWRIQLGPESARTYINRGNAYLEKKAYDQAIADYNQVIQLDPKSVEAYNNRGYACSLKGDYDRAIADYSQAIQLDPKTARAYINRAVAYRFTSDNDRAIADLDQLIQVYPKESSY
jgi:tetratricopeptide (TPR) repeat protein